MTFRFTFASLSIILGLATIFMIAGLYAWIVFGLDVQNHELQIIEKQNRDLNNKQLALQNTTLTNQELIKNNEGVLHGILVDIHAHVANGTTLTREQLKIFESEEPDVNHTLNIMK